MNETPSRRDFLRWGAGALAGLGLAPTLLSGRDTATSPSGARRSSARARRASPPVRRAGDRPGRFLHADGLPPRTVGLRSLGGDFAFDPVGLRLEPGDRLTWLNMGDFHTTTAFHPDNGDLLAGGVPLRIPEGAESWHSGMLGLDAGTEFTHTFGVPGVYDYFCQPHYGFGMVGRIVVSSPDGARPAARPASELNEASREVMPAAGAIVGPSGRAYEWAARINGVLLLRAHGEPARDPTERLVAGLAADRQLAGLLERAGEAESAVSSLDRLLAAVRSEADYETLVSRADEAKAALASAERVSG